LSEAICIFPENPTKGKDAHQGGVLLFQRRDREPLALMMRPQITAIRTALFGAATRLLARADAGNLAIVGAECRHAHT